MRAIAVALGLFLGLIAQGQQNMIGFSGGPSLCDLHGNTVFKEAKPIMGYQFGGQYTRWFKKGLGLRAQVTVARMGGSLDFVHQDVFGVETGRDKIAYRFDHIGISLGAEYRTRGLVHAQFQLGLMPSLAVAGEVRSPAGFNDQADFEVTELTNKVNNPILFGYGAFGGAVDLKAPITMGLLVRYDQGLTTLSRSDFFGSEDIIETSWSVMLSISYRWPQVN